MPAAPAPVLVYDRIDANRRATRLLLAAFAALLLPIAYTAAQYFAMALALASRAGASPPVFATNREVFAGWTALAALLSASALAYLGYACATFVLLRHVGARPASRELAPELFGLVESLSIGAGLPLPQLYIIESLTPNAFTIGADPRRASLVVTRGLLQLLDRRELAAVIAHELSHIGNRDTDLSLALSALVATVRMPQTAVSALIAAASTIGWVAGFVVSCALIGVVLCAVVMYGGVAWLDGSLASVTPLQIAAVAGPLYAVAIAPRIALWLRAKMIMERESLADADAVLLTRDPDAVALALAKVGGASVRSMRVGEATAHLYFVNPLHPAIEERIAILFRMGDGVPGVELQRALDAGIAFRDAPRGGRMPLRPDDKRPGTELCTTERGTMLYRSADGTSQIIADLDAGVPLTVLESGDHFIHVRAVDGTTGYVPAFARLVRASDTAPAHSRGGIHHRKVDGPSLSAIR
jgi:heat shock protein HtpX